jgi:hypothetical protein
VRRLAGRALAVAGVLGALGLVFASPAAADNCGSLSDCFFTLAIALAVAAFLALLLAFIIGSGGTGLFALAGVGTWGSATAVSAALTNAAAAAAAAAAASAAAGAASATIAQMSSSGTPGNNQAQNKQFRDAIRAGEREIGRSLSKDEIRQVHDAISGENLGYHEIVEVVKSMFGGG